MPCYQSSSLPSGTTTAGRTPYKTQADCLNACKEGACCEGTTCTVKPQCQCRCASNSCCGPDTMTVNGITGPRCRGGTKSECDSRGGTWRPCIGCLADANLPDESICRSTDSPSPSQPVEPTFKGVGTVCDPNPCECYCADGTTHLPASLTVQVYGTRVYKIPCSSDAWPWQWRTDANGNLADGQYRNCVDLDPSIYSFISQAEGTYSFHRVSCKRWEHSGSLSSGYVEVLPTSSVVVPQQGWLTINTTTATGTPFGYGIPLSYFVSGVAFTAAMCAGSTLYCPGSVVGGSEAVEQPGRWNSPQGNGVGWFMSDSLTGNPLP